MKSATNCKRERQSASLPLTSPSHLYSMKLFGKAPQEQKVSPADAIRRLRDTLEMLEKREMHLESKVEEQLLEAKKRVKQRNKRGALICLKRKKGYETQIAKLSGARMTLEQQVMAIESANINFEAMRAMRLGANTMKSIHQNMDIDQVDDTMGEIQEQMDVANEISVAISQPLADEYDEADLDAELEALEQENLDDMLLDMEKPGTTLPSVASTTGVQASSAPAAPSAEPQMEDDDEAALRALEAEMAI